MGRVLRGGSSEFDLGICCGISARLERRNISRDVLVKAYGAANRNGTSFCRELIQQGVSEEQVYRAIADLLELEFAAVIMPSRVFISDDDKPPAFLEAAQVLAVDADGMSRLYMAPSEDHIRMVRAQLAETPSLRARLRICTPGLLRMILRMRHQKRLADRARAMTPDGFSAARVLHTPQAFGIAIGLYLFAAAVVQWPMQTALGLHIFLTLFFLGCVLIRLSAAVGGRRLCFPVIQPFQRKDLPLYSVLVPLYREREVVGQLIEALGKLNWPCSKLDIKLVCEMDDPDTITEIRKRILPPCFELIIVPPGGPKTKPNALNYALQFARGEIVAVFDAEDRPHPDQLLEAWQTFECGGSRLACVQAPLIIGNFRKNLLTRMFAFEYAALFRGLLPWLASRNLVIPLGGTSNHFRRPALEEVGGWDAFNVTEDADIAVRLARFGYRIGVIARGTIEDAPESFGIWRRQRSRWIKGWMQTWLVHVRQPRNTLRELGLWRFIINQIYTVGIIASALLHPAMLVMLVILAVQPLFGPLLQHNMWLLAIDAATILLAYGSFYVLGRKTMEMTELDGYAYILAIPVYWVLISLSAWRALWQLMLVPHLWEKTPHQPSRFYEPEPRNVAPRPIMD